MKWIFNLVNILLSGLCLQIVALQNLKNPPPKNPQRLDPIIENMEIQVSMCEGRDSMQIDHNACFLQPCESYKVCFCLDLEHFCLVDLHFICTSNTWYSVHELLNSDLIDQRNARPLPQHTSIRVYLCSLTPVSFLITLPACARCLQPMMKYHFQDLHLHVIHD